MSKKQGSKQQKTLSASKAHFMPRKTKVWTIAFRPSTHAKKLSVPLGFALRDLLKVSGNSKETRTILNSGNVLVDGIVRKARNFSIGLFDVIELKAANKAYRVLVDHNARLILQEISSPTGKSSKVCRITAKKAIKGGKILLSTNDGRNFTLDSTSLKPGDSLKTQLPENKITQELKLEKGSMVLLIAGKHVGKTAKIVDIAPGTLKKDSLITLKAKNEEFQTNSDNAFVIGKEKPEIEALKGE